LSYIEPEAVISSGGPEVISQFFKYKLKLISSYHHSQYFFDSVFTDIFHQEYFLGIINLSSKTFISETSVLFFITNQFSVYSHQIMIFLLFFSKTKLILHHQIQSFTSIHSGFIDISISLDNGQKLI